MQKGPSQVSSGNISPTVVGPQGHSKDVIILSSLILLLAGLSAVAWIYTGTSDPAPLKSTPEKIEPAAVADLLKKASPLPQAEASPAPATMPVTAPALPPADLIHADVFFEVGRKGLTDEAKAQLAAHGEFLSLHQDYAVLIQGYTDQQGSERYNKALGQKRAETVKTELLRAGVAEHRMKAVSLGEEGVLCVDTSDVCMHLNRRVHLEIRKIGQEHLALPPVPTATAIEPADPSMEQASGGPAPATPEPATTDSGVGSTEPVSGS